MPRNFTPADRDSVREQIESMDTTYDTTPCGPGLLIQETHRSKDNTDCFGGLMENAGWYMVNRIPRDGGDVVIIMPVTEVPS